MLDELLGRAELKARIEELEEEKRHLERRAEAEEERRSEAARKRQEAEAEVNRLEDRIEGLEERVERLSGDETVDVDFRGSEALRGERRDEILSRLASFETAPEGALTAMVDEEVPEAVSDALGERAALVRCAATPRVSSASTTPASSLPRSNRRRRPRRSPRGIPSSGSIGRGSLPPHRRGSPSCARICSRSGSTTATP